MFFKPIERYFATREEAETFAHRYFKQGAQRVLIAQTLHPWYKLELPWKATAYPEGTGYPQGTPTPATSTEATPTPATPATPATPTYFDTEAEASAYADGVEALGGRTYMYQTPADQVQPWAVTAYPATTVATATTG